MIHELREYWFSPANWARYLPLLQGVGMPIRSNAYGELISGWQANFADAGLVHFIHIWAYESLDHRARLRAELMKNEKWTTDFLPTASRLVSRQNISFLNPVVFDRERIPTNPNLVRFNCSPGTRGELLESAKALNLNCWATEAPNPNELLLMFGPDAGVIEKFSSANGDVNRVVTAMSKVAL